MFTVPGVVYLLLLVSLPVAFAAWQIRSSNLSWWLFWIGIAIGAASEIILNVALAGLSTLVKVDKLPYSSITMWAVAAVIAGSRASLIMESFRWMGFRWAKDRGRTYAAALTMAAGAGFVDTIVVALTTFLIWTLIALSCGKPGGFAVSLPLVNYTLTVKSCNPQSVVMPLFSTLLAYASSLLQALVMPVMYFALSIMVWMAITLHRSVWFVCALLWHFLLDSAYVLLTGFGYVPWVLPKLDRTSDQLAIVSVLLIALNLGFVAWSCRRAKGSAPGAAVIETTVGEIMQATDASADDREPGGV